MNYQDVFQALKGSGEIDLSALCLPLAQTSYVLAPIRCSRRFIDREIVQMLTEARNKNAESFLTYFTATAEQTSRWLETVVGSDRSRILFAVRNTDNNQLYGYMGLAYGDAEGTRIEGDAIVRFEASVEPGLMQKAFVRMVKWVKHELGIAEVWVRVLSDNPAIAFYERCGFLAVKETPLFELRGDGGSLHELSDSADVGGTRSHRTLVHMRYSM